MSSNRFLFHNGVVSPPSDTPTVSTFLESHPGKTISVSKNVFSQNCTEVFLKTKSLNPHNFRRLHDHSHSQQRLAPRVLGTALTPTHRFGKNSHQFEPRTFLQVRKPYGLDFIAIDGIFEVGIGDSVSG